MPIFVLFANLFLAFPLQQTYSNEVHCVEEILKVSWSIIISRLKTHLSRQTYIHFLWLEWTVDILNSLPPPYHTSQSKLTRIITKEVLGNHQNLWQILIEMNSANSMTLDQSFMTSLSVFSDKRLKRSTHQQPPTATPTPQRGDSLYCCTGRHPRLRSAWFSPLGVLEETPHGCGPIFNATMNFFKGIKRKTESIWTSLDLPWKGYFFALVDWDHARNICAASTNTSLKPLSICSFSLHTDDKFLLEFSSRKKKKILLMNQHAFLLSENYINCYVSHFGFNFQEI